MLKVMVKLNNPSIIAFKKHSSFNLLIVFALLFILFLIGITINAAATSVVIETESAQSTQNASVVSDASASGGNSLIFGSNTNETLNIATSVSQYGITWTFDKEYPVGTYANGDWWVIGPVKITSISPGWNGEKNGSMVNPASTGSHGYHTKVNGYTASLNVALDLPLTLNGESSLISTIGWSQSDPGHPIVTASMPGAPRPSLKTAAVLTVVGTAPPAGTFRPPYSAGNKPAHNVSQLNRNLLPKLNPVPNTPSLANSEESIKRLWLDHINYWGGRYIHPSENMPDYGRDLGATINDASLLLMLNYSDSEKENLLIHLVQKGIDNYGAALSAPSKWFGDAGGGHGGGRKWPILFAGLILNDANMKGIGTTFAAEKFQEDCQIYNTASPQWGEFHCTRPQTDPGSISYRTCCTANSWVGAILSARLMNAQGLWNNPALFTYQDNYMNESHSQTYHRAWTDFAEEMWDNYR